MVAKGRGVVGLVIAFPQVFRWAFPWVFSGPCATHCFFQGLVKLFISVKPVVNFKVGVLGIHLSNIPFSLPALIFLAYLC